jgi:hypothetical protein
MAIVAVGALATTRAQAQTAASQTSVLNWKKDRVSEGAISRDDLWTDYKGFDSGKWFWGHRTVTKFGQPMLEK